MAQDPLRYFRIEAREFVEELGKGILSLEKGTPVREVVPRLLRLAHSLKGAARVVRQRDIAEQAHAIESALAPLVEAPGPVPRQTSDLVLRLLDGIARGVAALAAPAPDAPRTDPPAEDVPRTVRADIGELDSLLGGIAEVHASARVLAGQSAALDRTRRLTSAIGANLEALRPADGVRGGTSSALDRIRSLTGELRGTLDGLSRSWSAGVDRLESEIHQSRESAERLRLVPAGTMFTSLERAMRDVAQVQGKRVSFEGRGGDVRLDAHVLDAMQSALLHIVRNAVAHGVEPATDRERAGKPPEGRVTLEVVRRGGRVSFSCSDDGRGVDMEAVRRAVERKGLASAEARDLGPDDLLRMVLRGGISTSTTVTEVSGRGIGLDVAREAAETLGGRTDVRSRPGAGTSVTLTVPLSLASLQAILVEASGVTAVIPMDCVVESLRLGPGDIASTGQGDTVTHGSGSIPFLPLSRVLPGPAGPPRRGRSWSAVVVRGEAGTAAVGVDRLRGIASVVIRPLPARVPAQPVVAGASLEVDGGPRLVLDPDGLVAAALRTAAGAPEPGRSRPAILVIDDSLTTRMLEQSILESAGYRVELANSGEEGLERAAAGKYALFLVDVEMPGIDGFEFVRRCRADAALRDVPAILVTSRSSREDRARGVEAGAQGYVAKGEFNQADLLERIRRLLE